MKRLTCLALFLFPVLAFAQDAVTVESAFDPMSYLKMFWTAATSGQYPQASAILVILIVGCLRLFGPKAHELLPDNVIWDKPLGFLFDTKIGGWCLNFLTTGAGALAVANAAGTIGWGTFGTVTAVAASTAGVFQLIKDLWEWWQKRSLPTPEKAQAAGTAAAAKPPAGGLGR